MTDPAVRAALKDLYAAAALLHTVADAWAMSAVRICESGEIDASAALDVQDARDLLAFRV